MKTHIFGRTKPKLLSKRLMHGLASYSRCETYMQSWKPKPLPNYDFFVD
jgi:hypothetical protein